MKKILILLLPGLLGSGVTSALVNSYKIVGTAIQNIAWNLNINENKTFLNDDNDYNGLVGSKSFIFNYQEYADNFADFSTKYKSFSFSNNYISANLDELNKTDKLDRYDINVLKDQFKPIDSLSIEHGPSQHLSNVYLDTQIYASGPTEITFLIQYSTHSWFVDTAPSYSIKIDSLTFSTSFSN